MLVEDQARVGKRRVAVDGRLLASEATGVASYARTMLAALTLTGPPPEIVDDATRGVFGRADTAWGRARRALAARRDGVVPLHQADGALWSRDVFRLAQARFNRSGRLLELSAPGAAGIVHWTYPVPVRIAGWANCYTVHDVIPLTRPALAHTDAAALRARLAAIVATDARLVTVSAHSRDAIVAALGIPAGRVVDCGSAPEPFPDAAEYAERLSPGSYFLFCGMDEPRKNLARIKAAMRASGAPRVLAIAGHDAAAEPDVVPLGYLSRSDLAAAIRGARALVFPSLEEGFGLPVIEAMALGTPVLTSDRGALAEVAGGAALLVDPEDVGAIADGIARLDRDDALVTALRTRGLERARAFSLAAFGQRLRALHAEIAGDSDGAP